MPLHGRVSAAHVWWDPYVGCHTLRRTRRYAGWPDEIKGFNPLLILFIKNTDLFFFCFFKALGLRTRGSSSLSGRRIVCTLSQCLRLVFVPTHQVASTLSNYLSWLPRSCYDSLRHRVQTQRKKEANFFYSTPCCWNWLDIRSCFAPLQ